MFAKRIASTLLLLGWTLPAVAGPSASTAPELPSLPAASWINSKPLKLVELRGRPVLVEFWTFDCSNCRNTLPWLKQVHAEFAPRGLVVIAVHSPEFDRERGAAAVGRAVRQLGIDYPVMVDDDFRYWNAIGNRYWPAFYLIGPDGRIVATRIGELHSGQRSADEFSALIGGLAVDPTTSDPVRR